MEISTQSGFEVLAVVVMSDHVHPFVNASPKFAPAKIFRLFKGMTSRKLKTEFESCRQYWYKHAALWAEGYDAGPGVIRITVDRDRQVHSASHINTVHHRHRRW